MFDEHNEERRELSGKSPGEIAHLAAANITLQDVERDRLGRLHERLHERLECYLAILAEHVPRGGSINVILDGTTPQILTLCRGRDGTIDGYDVADAVRSVDLGAVRRPAGVPVCDVLGFGHTAG